jgi:hypothetical protein
LLRYDRPALVPRKPMLGLKRPSSGKDMPLQPEKPDATSKFDRTDYSVVVKNRGRDPNPWKWEIYPGRSSPIKLSSVNFTTMTMASRAGKEALKWLLEELYSLIISVPAGLPVAGFLRRLEWSTRGVERIIKLMNLQTCVHARLASHHGSDSGGRILPSASKRVHCLHGLVCTAALLITGRYIQHGEHQRQRMK